MVSKNLFWTVADVLRHVPSKVPDNDCSKYFMVLYLSKIPIVSMYVFCLYMLIYFLAEIAIDPLVSG